MAYSIEEIEAKFKEICLLVSEGKALRNVLKMDNMPSTQTFYIWLEKDKSKQYAYARATSDRADVIFEDMFDIADDSSNDFTEEDIGDGMVVEKLNSSAAWYFSVKIYL
jgi:hypothetical protein